MGLIRKAQNSSIEEQFQGSRLLSLFTLTGLSLINISAPVLNVHDLWSNHSIPQSVNALHAEKTLLYYFSTGIIGYETTILTVKIHPCYLSKMVERWGREGGGQRCFQCGTIKSCVKLPSIRLVSFP